MSINNWKSMKNAAASSEKRGRGRNGDEHRARERERATDWQRHKERVRHPKTATEVQTELERNSKSKIHLTHADTRQHTASQGKLPSLDRRARGEKRGRFTVGGRPSAGDSGQGPAKQPLAGAARSPLA